MPARCFKDNRGVAAVEFALIVPILLLLFVGTLEISLAVAVDRKISRISSSVADLITQEDNYTKDDLNKISDIAARIMYPYYTEAGESSAIKISIVGVEINSSNVAKVDWAHSINGAAKPAKGTDYEVPTSIRTADTFLLATKVEIAHKPAFSFVGFDGRSLSFDDTAIDLSEQMYLRPRRGDSIDCTDC